MVNSKEMRALLTRKLHIIALAAVLSAALVYGYLHMPEETTYSCTSSVFVSEVSAQAEGATGGDSLRELAASMAYMLNTKSFIDGVLAEQGLERGAFGSIAAELVKDSSAIEIVASGKSPSVLEKVSEAVIAGAERKAEALGIRLSLLEAGRAVQNAPARTGAMKNSVLGFFAGALLAACIILLRYYFSDSVKNDGEVLEYTGMPTVARLPEARHDDVDTPLQDMPKAYREQVGRLAFYAGAGHTGHAVVGIANVSREDSRPATAFRLSEMLAYKGSSVLLVILDQNAKPGQKPFWKDSRREAAELFKDGADISALAVEASGHPGLMALWAAGLPAMYDNRMMARLSAWVAAAKEKYDYVVLQLPSVSQYPDVALLPGLADKMFLVASAFHTKAGKLISAADMARSAGIDAAGFVLTRAI